MLSKTKQDVEFPFSEGYYGTLKFDMQCITVKNGAVVLNGVEFKVDFALLDINVIAFHTSVTNSHHKGSTSNVVVDNVLYPLLNFIVLKKLRNSTTSPALEFIKSNFNTLQIPSLIKYFGMYKKYHENACHDSKYCLDDDDDAEEQDQQECDLGVEYQQECDYSVEAYNKK